ncbi:voltage-dependent anion channel-domain-containing protein [Delphinella strobiligena]|nr:voltage-dependent anion channel-domain-containing protein [Delphinella strobiligena]
MSTGAIETLLAQQPYSFDGLETIGKIFFILDLVLFVTFCILITFRFPMKSSALGRSLHHPHESFYFGTFLVSIALILYCSQEYGVLSSGPWLVYALKVCFWIYAGIALVTVVFQYHVIFDTESLPVYATMPAWMLTAYPFLTLRPLAAVLEYTFLMYTLYFTRLISHELPEEPKGRASYTSEALIEMALQAPKVIPDHFLGLTAIPAAQGFWSFSMATVSVLSRIRKMHFTLNYWAFIFPIVGLTIALFQIGNALDSACIKAVCSAMSILLKVLWPGMDEDKEDIEGHSDAEKHERLD